MRLIGLIVCFLFFACGSHGGKADTGNKVYYMPENHLFTEDDNTKEVNANGVDEQYFNDIIAKAQDIYSPIFAEHGGNLVIKGDWSNSTVNAYANRDGSDWIVQMFGGMARRNEITREGFALVLCHEIGHHLAGFPTYSSNWASNEGNSDFYATAGCAAKLFGNTDTEPQPTPTPKQPCPFVPELKKTPCMGFSFAADKTICEKSMEGSLSLGKLLAVLGGEKAPSYNTPDQSKVTKTSDSHPKAQCRLDTMYLGILCTKSWNDSIIPKNKSEMAAVSCSSRPACWYKS